MTHSLVIRNARIVDGSGRPAFRGDVAVTGDRISEVGEVADVGAVEIDAGGLVLAPGFIDVHTHYDPQLCWDKLATPTPEHGVTSLIMGNCSVSLAPVVPEAKDKLIGWFGSVEDMDGELMRQNVDFDWETVEQYLKALRPDLGPNVGVLIGHAVIRAYVMGAAAQERAATDEEIARMAEILRDALRAGAFGLSFTFNHLDDRGEELPCRYADRRELVALLREVAEADRMVEVAPDLRAGSDPLHYYDLFGELSIETGARVSLSPILVVRGQNIWKAMVERLEGWRARGARLFAQTQVRPLDMTVSLVGGSPIFGKTPLWRSVMDAPRERRAAMLAEPGNREVLVEEADQMSVIGELEVRTVHSDRNRQYAGRKLGEIAAAGRRRLGDVLIDIVLADNLETEFLLTGFVHDDAESVATLLHNPAIHVGSADAGAHITSFSGAGDTCYLFEKYVRKEKAMRLERAVQRLTSDIARDWGIADRGGIIAGYYADLVVFDPETIARKGEVWVEDLPSAGGRYVRGAQGIAHVIVNGEVLVNGADYTDARPGKLL
ncbi:N-acyl-D-aspartate/D-glutamate deacylase [Sphingobium faniae]|nr:N-acyl-D-aspartate/D-glutamate deacylase [Sphingobium faniae]